MTPAALLLALEAAGVRVTLNAAGDGLTVTGQGRPPEELLAALRAAKPDVLPILTARADAVPVPASPDVLLPPWERPARPLLDWAAIAAQVGHCGSCARSTDAPDWGTLMVTCSAPSAAFEGSMKPLALHVGHRCAAYRQDGEDVGRGYRSRAGGKRYAFPLEGPVPIAGGAA